MTPPPKPHEYLATELSVELTKLVEVEQANHAASISLSVELAGVIQAQRAEKRRLMIYAGAFCLACLAAAVWGWVR